MGTPPDYRGLRIGLFGGTFNPIHLGHLRSAEEVREACALDCIYFVPAAQPPHKGGSDLAPATHRLKMVELAVADNPYFSASAIELERPGTSYSIDTIRSFFTALRPASLLFIVGIDAFREFATWKDYVLIPKLCDLLVTSRPGTPTPPSDQFLPVALQTLFWYDPKTNVYRHTSGHSLVLHEIAGLNIAASTIRGKVRAGKSIRYLVHPAVETYITHHALYQPEGASR
ncbi:MAG: nicotinate (nicotinamide) nucleotide adenylyltransferase [Deltaproteobacteria bacterium]|nr:nicotinate (nicotinamide) nucleotide adenylyltransferase [Deltaproteobacteria bacterium]